MVTDFFVGQLFHFSFSNSVMTMNLISTDGLFVSECRLRLFHITLISCNLSKQGKPGSDAAFCGI